MFDRPFPDYSGWQRLSQQIESLRNGNGADYCTELVSCLSLSPDEGRDVVAQLVWDFCSLSDCPSYLVAFEKKQRLGHGTYSKTAGYFDIVNGRRTVEQGITRYFKTHHTAINRKSAAYASQKLRSWLKKGTLRSVSIVDAAASLDKCASRGWPWFARTADVPFEYFNYAERILADNLDPCHAHETPGVLGKRGQPAALGQLAKTRAIFGYSLVPNILKKMLFIPLFDALVEQSHFCANFSREAVDWAVTGVLERTRGLILSVDFSNFDASIPFEVIDACFDAMRYWFHPSDEALVRWCQESFKRTGIYVPGRPDFELLDGSYRLGGVPSGSVLTNLIDSMVNFWAVVYAAHRLGASVEEYLLQGDDGVYTFSKLHSYEALSEVLLVELGMLMSPSKCHISATEVHYLQMVHSRSWVVNGLNVGVRPIMRVLNGMMSYEYKRADNLGVLFDGLRWLQQVDNCSAHPCFRQMCKWLKDHGGDGVMEALTCLVTNNQDLLSTYSALVGHGNRMTTDPDMLYSSPVVRAINDLVLTGECLY